MASKPISMDERVKKLEAQVIELSSKVDTRSQAIHDLMEKFAAQMAGWKDEMMEIVLSG